jgi:DUF4097 and DUF4098 domain-containing protein YvlB
MTPAQLEGRFERLLTVSGRVRLELEVSSGTVRVAAGEPGTVRVRGIVRAREGLFGLGDPESRVRELEENPPIEQNGNEIRVEYDGGFLSRATLLLDITVPRDCSVRAKADSGGIRVEGVQGPLECSTDSGYLEAFDIGGEVRAEADSGRIEVRRVAGSVELKVDSGEIQALEIGGAIEAEADSGSIRLSQTAAGRVRAKADSGSILLTLAPGAGYTLRARADSGNIHVPELSRRKSSRNEVEGDIRGGGPSVDLEVDSGDIDVE